MAASDYAALLSALGPKSLSGFIAAMEERGIYVVDAMEDPQDLNAGNIKALLFNGVIFWIDPSDSLTAHDGVTCIVTAEGNRYKSDQYSGVSSRWVPVKDKDLTAPPGSPAIGDTYIVAAGGTGAWATKDKKFATWTARGWVFLTPKAFDYAYVIDEVLIYHYSAGGVWTSGIPASTIGNSTISQNKLRYFKIGGISVENQTTNDPPAFPASNGVAYIVGGAPSGAWVGHSLELAIGEDGAWVFYTPYEGAQVYDKTLNANIQFDGTIWVTAVSGYSQVVNSTVAAGPTNITGTYAYSGTAPTTSNMTLLHSVSYTPKKVGAKIEVALIVGDVLLAVNSGAGDWVLQKLNFGLFIDATANSEDWTTGPWVTGTAFGSSAVTTVHQNFHHVFHYTSVGTTAITIKIYGSKPAVTVISGSGGAAQICSVSKTKIIVREVA